MRPFQATVGWNGPHGPKVKFVGVTFHTAPVVRIVGVTPPSAKSLGGSAGCNSYSGGRDSGKYIATAEGALTIPPLAVTEMFCSEPEGVMEQEEAYIHALHNAATYQLIEGRLEIADGDGETTLVFARKE